MNNIHVSKPTDRHAESTGSTQSMRWKGCGTTPLRWRSVWKTCRVALESVLFPVDCQICGAEQIPSGVCEACRDELVESDDRVCHRCAMPIGPLLNQQEICAECLGRSFKFDAVIALGPYKGPIRSLCLRLKDRHHQWLAPRLADLVLDARAARIKKYEFAGVVPLALHWMKRRTRGYDQSEALARQVAKRLQVPMIPALRRVRQTKPLYPMSRTDRNLAVKNAFAVNKRWIPRLQGKAVLLVDDILTTGATCNAASQTLKKAGVKTIIVLVIGRAGDRPR